MDTNTVTSSKIHHHIRWVPSGAVDWERHETRTEAEESAKRLLRRYEGYVIEQFDEACNQCAALRAGTGKSLAVGGRVQPTVATK